MTDPTVEFLAARKIAKLRRRAHELAEPPENCPEGWFRRPDDPARILALFDGLRLKTGFVLRAYQFIQGGNGNGVVWALPETADFPDPAECQQLEGRFLSPPKPPEALDDFREAIEGDGSPLSYLSASLASRELREFGAMWHGVSWGTVEILDTNPWEHGEAAPDDLRRAIDGDWQWQLPRPEDWRPRAEVEGDTVRVTLLGYTGFVQHRLFEITDLYQLGSYVFETVTSDLALGSHGWIP